MDIIKTIGFLLVALFVLCVYGDHPHDGKEDPWLVTKPDASKMADGCFMKSKYDELKPVECRWVLKENKLEEYTKVAGKCTVFCQQWKMNLQETFSYKTLKDGTPSCEYDDEYSTSHCHDVLKAVGGCKKCKDAKSKERYKCCGSCNRMCSNYIY